MQPQQIIQWIVVYRYLVIFPIVVVEGPIVTMVCGFLVSLKQLSLVPTYIVLVVGDVIGDAIYYSIGRSGRQSWIRAILKKAGMTRERFRQIEGHFERNGGLTLLIGKFTHFFGGLTFAASGVTRMPFWKVVGYSLLGTIFKSALLMAAGYYFGSAYLKIDHYIAYVTLLIIGFIGLVALVGLGMRKLSQRLM